LKSMFANKGFASTASMCLDSDSIVPPTCISHVCQASHYSTLR
jgi:hypothetical protein